MSAPPPPLLIARGLSHTYGAGNAAGGDVIKPALDIRELSLAAGESALLMGDNGSGKSTLLRILAGVIAPSRCDYFLFDGEAKPPAPPAVGYLHQTPYLFNATTQKNVEYGLRRCGLPLERAVEAMEWAGIAHARHKPARALSGGEQRRVALARIRALRPRLYLLDEPLTHLDAAGKARVRDLIITLQREGATAIISSHHSDLPATYSWHLINGDIRVKNLAAGGDDDSAASNNVAASNNATS